MQHEYPRHLAEAVLEAWPEDLEHPPLSSIQGILSVCFLASLLREEARPITFRLLLSAPEELPEDRGPPTGIQCLRFDRPRSFHPQELRRLTPAVELRRAMVGIELSDGEPRIWGVVHTGPGWMRHSEGGRAASQELPEVMSVHVMGPGEVTVWHGSRHLASLRGGRVLQDELDVLRSRWLPEHFAAMRRSALELHQQAGQADSEPWATLDHGFVQMLSQHVMRRVMSVMRGARHGGTVLFLPPDMAEQCERDGFPHLTMHYRFADSPARRRYRQLLLETMAQLARLGGRRVGPQASVGWQEFSSSANRKLTELDEAIFEEGHLMAGLSQVDGALVLDQRFEILGFGAEITGALPEVEVVHHALDLEARHTVPDHPASFGTRHRSVFRLCMAHPGVLAIVVSQDGQVRFVKRFDDRLLFFNHRAQQVL